MSIHICSVRSADFRDAARIQQRNAPCRLVRVARQGLRTGTGAVLFLFVASHPFVCVPAVANTAVASVISAVRLVAADTVATVESQGGPAALWWKDYFPVVPLNAEWRYSQILEGSTPRRQIAVMRYEGRSQLEDQNAHRYSLTIRRAPPESGEVTQMTMYFLESSEGFSLARQVSGTWVSRYQPPLPFLGPRSRPGFSDESVVEVRRSDVQKPLNSFRARVTVVRFERLSVPAGDFDALKITLESPDRVETLWLAPGIGIAKRQVQFAGFGTVAVLTQHPGTLQAEGQRESPARSRRGESAIRDELGKIPDEKPRTFDALRAELGKIPDEKTRTFVEATLKGTEDWIKRNKLDAGISCHQLSRNPFAWEGKLVGVPDLRFVQVRDRGVAIFSAGRGLDECNMLVSGIPSQVVTTLEETTQGVLAVRVLGIKQVSAAMGTYSLPHVQFVGAFLCSQSSNRCRDALK